MCYFLWLHIGMASYNHDGSAQRPWSGVTKAVVSHDGALI